MFILNKTFWNETEHISLQAGVPILQTRPSMGFAGDEWETSFRFSLKLNSVSEWSVSPIPHGWCLGVSSPGLCFVFCSGRRSNRKVEENARVFYNTSEKWFWDPYQPVADDKLGTWEVLRAKFLKKSKVVWLNLVGLWDTGPKRVAEGGNEKRVLAWLHTCGFRNPYPPWCEFISICHIA